MDEFLQKIEQHKDEFYRFVRRTAWDVGVADDIFSSAVLAAYENRHKYTPGTNFRAWMFRILQNKCFVANRHTSRSMEPLESAEHVGAETRETYEYRDILQDPMKVLDSCGDEVVRAFERLSTAERACILLRGAEKFSYQEIAEILGIPVGTVMTHLSRGRAKLRKELTEYAAESGIIRKYPRIYTKASEKNGTEQ